MKLEFSWPSVSEKTFNILMGLQHERHWLKGQP